MSSSQPQLPTDQSEQATLELYKIAFSRLNFQDEYLFKFSTVFLTAHGALAVLAGSAYFQKAPPELGALMLLSSVAVVLAIAWALWTRHNHYWHCVWIGTLRDIEQNHLSTNAKVFYTPDGHFAKPGMCRPLLRGHHIAQIIPIGLCLAWALVLVLAICRRFQ